MTVCPACAQENPEGFKFCGNCGTTLVAPPALREQLKTVTVVFCDVTGSTELGERLDPESLRRVMARYFEVMRQVIERHGGTVEKFIGDAVMAVFGVPVLHEDDALRAVRASCEMREALGPLNEELERDYGTTLALRTGLNTGQVVTGTDERLATGDAVNVAARLEQAAEPGEILLGVETLALVRDAVEMEARSPLELKGKSEPLRAYSLLGVRVGAPGFTRRTDAPLVGRERELRRLLDSFEQASADRSCQLFTLLGAAGVGKSRLAAAFLAELEATVVQGRCLDYGEGITYWPVVEVLRQLLGGDLAARMNELSLDQGARTALAGLLGEGSSASSSAEIARAVRKLLEAAASERPLVVVFDDIQWAEPTFFELLEHVADLSRDAAILLLCMARPELRERRAGWGGGIRNATTLLLEPLSQAETEELIAELVGATSLDAALRERIATAAEGNPLFVEEMLALVRESRNGEVKVPPTIQALLAARLDQLESPERAVLERGSIEGSVFHLGGVQALAPEEPEPGARLTALVQKELLRPEQGTLSGEDAYRFRHLLIREAAYEALPKAVRAELHERFASWLEAQGEELIELEELLGYHLEQAFRYRAELGPLDEQGRQLAARAGQHLALAGRQANERGDAFATSGLLGRAVELLPPDDPTRCELLIELSEALSENGELERAEAVLAEAIEAATRLGDLRLGALARLQRVALSTVQGGEVGAALIEAQACAELLTGFDDEAALARAGTLVGRLHFWLGNCALAETVLRRALEHARRGGRPRDEELALARLAGVARHGPTPLEQALRFCETLLEETRGSRSHLEASELRSIGVLYGMRGEFDRARAALQASQAINVELGQRVSSAGFTMQAAEVELLAGEPAAAERLARAGYEELERLGEKGLFSSVAAVLARAIYLQGRDEEAEQFTRASENAAPPDDFFSQADWRAVRALIYAKRGRLEEAEALAREAVQIVGRTDYVTAHADALCDLAEVLRLTTQSQEAVSAAEKALRLYEQKGNVVSAKKAKALLGEIKNDSRG